MIIEIEIPDDTSCVFISYVYGDCLSMHMGVKGIDTNELSKLSHQQGIKNVIEVQK